MNLKSPFRNGTSHLQGGELCMKGGIYSDEKCLVCGGKLHDTGSSLACSQHPKSRATRFKVIFGNLCKRFRSYEEAFRFLNGVRYETDRGNYDERDYQKDNPLAFSNVTDSYLAHKKGKIKPRSLAAIKWHLEKACDYFKNKNVKEVKYGDLEDFLESLSLSDKTKHNILSTLHSMFVWISRREQKRIMPDFPQQTFELGMRATISKKQQLEVLEHIRKTAPVKVYLGIKWLCTYIAIRPGEMINLKEGDIDRANGYLYFPHPKEKKFKAVPILPEDIALLEDFPLALPSMPFFRHSSGISGVAENDPYGIKYFYKWWKKSCSALGIEGVDLYGGTRHSSARALRAFHSPEEIKRATMHTTNKAFERYFQIEAEDLRDIYRSTGTVVKIDNALTMKNRS